MALLTFLLTMSVLTTSFVPTVFSQLPPPNLMRDPSISMFSSLFGGGGFGRRGQPIMPSQIPNGFPEDYDMMPPAMAPVLMQNRMIPPMGDIIENDLTVGLGGPGMMPNYGGGPDPVAMASLMSYVSDKDNFQPQGCGWDGIRSKPVLEYTGGSLTTTATDYEIDYISYSRKSDCCVVIFPLLT